MIRAFVEYESEPDSARYAGHIAEFVTKVDCTALGANVAQCLGIGSADLYAGACNAGLTALASRIYARIAAIAPASLPLISSGGAGVVDRDGDRVVDVLTGGTWTGTLADVAVTGTFDGERR